MKRSAKKEVIKTLIDAGHKDLATVMSVVKASPDEATIKAHHPKMIAKNLINQSGLKAKVVELRGATLSQGPFKGVKTTLVNRGWAGSAYLKLEVTNSSGTFNVVISMSWSDDGEYSGSATADAPRGTIPLQRVFGSYDNATLGKFTMRAASDLHDWLGK